MPTLNRRELIAGALGSTLCASSAMAANTSGLGGSAHSVDPWALVDPELVPGLKRFIDATRSGLTQTPASVLQSLLPGAAPLPPPAPQATERFIPGPPSAPDVRILIVDPATGGRNRPALLHTHGGGFIGGRAQLSGNLQRIAQSCSCVIVSVDYRLAPAARFNASIEDNYAALRWLHRNAVELGVDPNKIAVGGESAGGGHAALLAIAARDRGEVPLVYQWLLYPMLDDRTGTSRPVPAHIGRFMWTPELNNSGWSAFLGAPAGSAQAPVAGVPARAPDLTGLPPAFIGVGSLDLFVQEDVDYATRLTVAGVPTELHVVPGAYHGFDLVTPQASVSRRLTESWLGALRQALG